MKIETNHLLDEVLSNLFLKSPSISQRSVKITINILVRATEKGIANARKINGNSFSL